MTMPQTRNNSCLAVYQLVLEPWTRLAASAPDVIGLRLSSMPWLLLLDPAKAMRETQRMVTEKQEAWNETLLVITQTPMQLFVDTLSASWGKSPHTAFNRAIIKTSRRVARPSNSRVTANQKRLTR